MNQDGFWKQRVREGAVLNVVDRVSEVLFGLIMVLTFTGAISVANDGREEVRQLLWAALGCNLAWGLVDAVMYVMNVLLERGHALTVLNRILSSESSEKSREILKEEIQPLVSGLLDDKDLDGMISRMQLLPHPSARNLFTIRDLVAGGEIFLLVFLCTLPVAIPFALFDEMAFAMRASNGIALFMLFVGGLVLGRYAGFSKIVTATVYTIIGVVLVSITMALGG